MTPEKTLTVLACQLEIPETTTAKQRDNHLHAASIKVCLALKERPADIVVLPELSSIDYSVDAFENLDKIAESVKGQSFQIWRDVAIEHQVCISYGFARKDGDDIYISMAAVNSIGGLLGYYDKLQLAQYGASVEKDYFNRGKHLFAFNIKEFTLAPIICYDIRIPELSRALVLDCDADVILHCGAYFRDESFHTWHAFATSRAIENQCYLLSLNRAGIGYGSSILCRPWQDENTPPVQFAETSEDFRYLILDRQELDYVRKSYSFLRDRLPSYNIPLATGSLCK